MTVPQHFQGKRLSPKQQEAVAFLLEFEFIYPDDNFNPRTLRALQSAGIVDYWQEDNLYDLTDTAYKFFKGENHA